MGDDVGTTAMSVPLDSDGFLRRECPTCEREFKWLPNRTRNYDEVDEAVATISPDGYLCPYCGISAPPDAWNTRAQIEHAKTIVMREVVAPKLEGFRDSLRDMARRSGGLISVELQTTNADEPIPLSEDDDMRRVDFTCHPDEPIKVLDDWEGHIHCLVCGANGTEIG